MAPQWKIVVGADSAGQTYKDALKADLEKDPRVASVLDVGVGIKDNDVSTDYPHVAVDAARKVASGECDRALLVCGTGLGVAISANKVVSYGRWRTVEMLTLFAVAWHQGVYRSVSCRFLSNSTILLPSIPPCPVKLPLTQPSDSYSVERLILSNNAQVLCLGQRVIGLELARKLVKEWLGYVFDESSSSAPKVEAIKSYEVGGKNHKIESVPGDCS